MLWNSRFSGTSPPRSPWQVSNLPLDHIAPIYAPLGRVLIVMLVEHTPFHPDVLWHDLDNHFDYPVNHVLMSITKGRFFKFLHALVFILKILPFFWKPPLLSKIPRCAPGFRYHNGGNMITWCVRLGKNKQIRYDENCPLKRHHYIVYFNIDKYIVNRWGDRRLSLLFSLVKWYPTR